jgi:hypothetical protein
MTLYDEVKMLDEKINAIDMPFDKGLPLLQNLLWEIADRHNTTGQEVLRMYFDMKSAELKKDKENQK